MKFFACLTCNKFGYFSSTCPKIIRKTRKSLLFDQVKEFKLSMEIFLNDCDNELELVNEQEVVEEIALVTIVYPKANHENVEVIVETNNDLQNDVLTSEQRGEERSKTREEIRVEFSTPTPNNNLIRNHPPKKIIGSKDKGVRTRNREMREMFDISS